MALTTQAKTGLIAVAVVGGLFLIVAIVVAVLIVVPRSGGTGGSSGMFASTPKADKEGETWTLKDLVGHLRDRKAIGPFADADTHYVQSAVLNPYPRVEFTAPDLRGLDRDAYRSIRLTIVRTDGRDKAKDLAGSVGAASFSWGRFSFSGEREHIDKCKAALGL